MLRIKLYLFMMLLSVPCIQAQDAFVPYALSYSPDGQYVAGVGNRVVVWDGETGGVIATIELPLEEYALFADAAWSPDSERLAIAGEDRRMRVLDFSSDAQPFGAVLADVELATYIGVRSIAWSPDGSLIAIGGDEITPRLEFRDGISYEFIRASTYVVGAYQMAWNPDTQRNLIATTDIYLAGAQLADAGENVTSLPQRICGDCAADAIALHVAWNNDGTLLAIGHNDGSIFIVNTETSTIMASMQTSIGVSVLAWTNDDQYLLSMSRAGLQVWDSVTWSLLYSPTVIKIGRFDINPLNNHLFYYDFANAPSGVIIDISTLIEPASTPTATFTPVNPTAIQPEIKNFARVRGLALNPDGQILAIGGRYHDQPGIWFYDLMAETLHYVLST